MYKRTSSNESISFQNDKFGKDLEKILTDIQIYVKENSNIDTKDFYNNSNLIKDLSKCIKDCLGLTIKFVSIDDLNAHGSAVTTPFSLSPHVLNNYGSLNLLKLLNDPKIDITRKEEIFLENQTSFYNKKSYIDLKNAKVSGAFSDYISYVAIGFITLFKKDTTPPEVTGLLLHELGHVFSEFELCDRLERTNQVLSDLSKVVKENKVLEKKEYIVKELESIVNLTKDDIDKLLKSENRVAFGYNLFSVIGKEIKSQTNIDIYNETSSEQLADNFAVRFGYGKELISYFEKNRKDFELINKPNVFIRIIFYIMYFSFLTLFFIMIIGVGASAIVAAAGAITPGLAILYLIKPIIYLILGLYLIKNVPLSLSNSPNNDLEPNVLNNDDVKNRYIRIRQQYIEKINQIELPKDELKLVIETIYSIDGIIKKTKDVDSGILNTIQKLLFSKQRNLHNEIELQRLLESLSHSDLFLKSAEFKLLS